MTYLWSFAAFLKVGNLQCGKEEKNPFGIKDPGRWWALETVSPNASAIWGAIDGAGGDSDLMMNLWATGMIWGPHRYRRSLFRRARPY